MNHGTPGLFGAAASQRGADPHHHEQSLVSLSDINEIELTILRRMREVTMGDHRAMTHGTGFDFVGLRDWQAGDLPSQIDWPQSTLTNFSPMIVREFEQPSTASVVVVADRSPSTLCGINGVPIAAAIIGSTLPPQERGPALGTLGTVFGLAFIIGPVLGGLLLPFGWHWLFLINLPIAAVLIAGAFRLLPATKPPARKPLDVAGIATLSLLLTALVFGLNGLDTTAIFASLLSWPVALALVLALSLMPVFWRIETRAVDPIIRPGLFKSGPVVIASLIGAGIGAIQSAGTFYPALAIAATGVSASTASWLLLPGVVGATIASPVSGRLINRVGTRRIVIVSLAMVVASVLMFAFAPISIPVFVLASFVGSTGLGGVLGAPLRLVILDNCLPAERGSAQGILSNLTSVGRLLGATFVGSVAASVGGGIEGYQAAFMGMVVVAAAMLALGLALTPPAAKQPLNSDQAPMRP